MDEWRKINYNSPQLWQHTLTEELQLDPSQHPMLLTEVPLNPVSNREMMSEIMFEKFQVNEEYPHELLIITSSVVEGCERRHSHPSQTTHKPLTHPSHTPPSHTPYTPSDPSTVCCYSVSVSNVRCSKDIRASVRLWRRRYSQRACLPGLYPA